MASGLRSSMESYGVSVGQSILPANWAMGRRFKFAALCGNHG